jgi:2'-hydroxyisoflavone reductase
MKLLVLGGGGFLGHHVVAAARSAGHETTVFTRSGHSELDVEVLTGDRTGDLSALRGRSWDAVLDTYTDSEPGAPAVRATAELLTGSVGSYGYVSGMSVYAPSGPARPDESAPVRRAGREPDDDPLQARSVAKLAAEAVLAEVFDGPVLLPRVGIMVGPRDPSHRFTWWPLRMHRALQGSAPRTVLAPGDPGRAVQYSDARDIAGWVVGMLGRRRGGTYNTVGPGRDDRLGDVVRACLEAAGGTDGDVELRWTGEDRLRELLDGVEEEQRPLWFPEDQIPQAAIDSTAALAAGLVFRPVADTARETLEWALRERADGLVDGPFERRITDAAW